MDFELSFNSNDPVNLADLADLIDLIDLNDPADISTDTTLADSFASKCAPVESTAKKITNHGDIESTSSSRTPVTLKVVRENLFLSALSYLYSKVTMLPAC